MHVHIIGDRAGRISEVAARLPSFCMVTTALLADAIKVRIRCDAVVVAVDLNDNENILALKEIFSTLSRVPRRLFLLDRHSRLSVCQSYALGATSVLKMTAEPSAILSKLFDQCPVREKGDKATNTQMVTAIAAGYINSMFGAVTRGDPIDVAGAMRIGSEIIDRVSDDGLAAWLGIVRQHHEGTFQHCLLVTGVTADFGLKIGLSAQDLQHVVLAATLHDIGKAVVPVSILEKPGRLNDEERATIETHPGAGFDELKNNPAIATEILDAVRHHHEFLDGSGYPDKLEGASISDLTRILTISDMFSALIEVRSYRPAMPRADAFEILRSMKGRLEMPLVEAFREVALHR